MFDHHFAQCRALLAPDGPNREAPRPFDVALDIFEQMPSSEFGSDLLTVVLESMADDSITDDEALNAIATVRDWMLQEGRK
jgi:hypothetical protein